MQSKIHYNLIEDFKERNIFNICIWIWIWIWMVFFINSLRRIFLNDKTLPYVKRIYLMTSYWPSRVTEEVALSFDGGTTLHDFVFSGQFLTRVHYELRTYRLRSLIFGNTRCYIVVERIQSVFDAKYCSVYTIHIAP